MFIDLSLGNLLLPNFFLIPTTTIASPRQGIMLARQDPRSQIESTDREYSTLGSWRPGGAILHWPIAVEFHNSMKALLSPFLGWVAYSYSKLRNSLTVLI